MAVSTLSGTAWILELGIRVTLGTDRVFRTLRGFEPTFDPAAVTFVTDRTVGNLAAHHGIRILGDTVSPKRLAEALAASTNGKDRALTLEDLANHPHLGKGWTAAEVLAAYAEEDAVVAA